SPREGHCLFTLLRRLHDCRNCQSIRDENKHGRLKAEKGTNEVENYFRRRELSVMNAYKKVMKQIHASEEFKSKMQKEMMEFKQKEKRVYMKNIRLMAGCLVACAVIAVVAL